MNGEGEELISRMEAAISDAYDRTRRVNALVNAVNRAARDVEITVAGFSKWGLRQEMENGIGMVIVNGNGELVRIDFDHEKVSISDPSQLGKRIVSAVNVAEERVRKVRLQRVKQSLRGR
ncbi:YbaB/EbfC family nucleoid-associated protein [Actinoallomurus soli]|uniref:YbaB/EbfC family nucleoid-associated protein n=1 Tax=Actinoallomurus soli TaxID=2952535 RepID=UPI0020937BCB|nr:YbaB/EbfC family nucleoid-associated protein [Actinoallomurus soli]MCO5966921.1 YbaB/EbfC family nucleoid-associated protein [Actinoallomurus soli]